MAGEGADPEIQRLGEAINRARIRLECPSCRQKKWLPYERPVHLPASGNFPEGFTTLAMVCAYCGFVRLHAAGILERFMDRPGD